MHVLIAGKSWRAIMKEIEDEDHELNAAEKEELIKEIRDLYRVLVSDFQCEEDK